MAPSTLTLALLISFASVSAILFSPAIPDIASYFDVSLGKVQLMISLYMLGYAIAQLFYGSLSRKWGRKPTILLGLWVAIVATILCAFSQFFQSFTVLILFRFIGAFGAAVGYSLSFTIINDFYPAEEARKIIPKAALGLVVLPSLGIFIGGFLVEYLGWASTFYFLTLYGIVILALAMRLPETGKPDPSFPLHCRTMWTAYVAVLKVKRLVLYSFIIFACVAEFYTIGGLSPVLAIEVMGLSSSVYGMFSLFFLGGLLGGNLFARFFANKIPGEKAVVWGLVLQVFGFGLLFLLFLFHIVHPLALFLPIFIGGIGMSYLWANAAGLATKDIEDRAHAASAMAFINVSGGFVGILVISIFPQTAPLLLPLALLVLTGIQIVLCSFVKRV